MLPAYGCCDLGCLNLTCYVDDPFGDAPTFDFDRMKRATALAVRALDNVLDLTLWPLPAQEREAREKRRIGLGFTGLGNALTMLKLRYDSEDARRMAARISQVMRDTAYEASVALAREKGAFPLFDAEQYLAEPHAASRLPDALKAEIRTHGLRNSHLLSIAPTGTISIAFAGNASGGIEPAFSWTYTRKKRMPDGSRREYAVEDFAYRLYRHLGGNVHALPEYFVSAMQISALDHMRMSAAVQPYVDSAISKTVNVAEDYPYEEFKALYLEAWRAGLKGITTYRPNAVIGSVLSTGTPAATPGRAQRSAARRDQPPAAPREGAAPGAGFAALAGPPDAAGRQPVVVVHGRAGRRARSSRSSSARPTSLFQRTRRHDGYAQRALRDLGQRQRAAARPGRDRQGAVDGHALQRPRVAAPEARDAGQEPRRAAAADAVPAGGQTCTVPASSPRSPTSCATAAKSSACSTRSTSRPRR
jgi:ribonucleoside-diphosphate reductase alpha chain